MGAESTTRGVCFPCLVEQEVLQESYMMIPDSKGRLQASIQDMKAFLVSFLIGGGGRGSWEEAVPMRSWRDWRETVVYEADELVVVMDVC